MTLRALAAALVLPVLLIGCSGASADSPPAPTPAPTRGTGAASVASGSSPATPGGIYREAQADHGREVFRDRCSECHYSSEMRGTQFQFEWERRTVGDLYDHLVKTMPEDAPGSLTPTEYVEVVAYILRLNGFPAGAVELRSGDAAFETSLEAPPGSR